MNICSKCKAYTRSNNPICYHCYIEGGKFVKGFTSYSFEKTPLNFIKGHIGESIIQNLFSSLGFIVFRYGIENNLTYINEYLDDSDFSKTELNILTSRPDLLVLNKEKKRIYFTEIKYRWSGKFEYSELGEDYKYQNTYIIVLSKSGFKCIKASELKKITAINIDCTEYDLCNNIEFNLDKGFVKLIENQALNIYNSIEHISHIESIVL
ncbi:hypothetical protein [Flavobacterium oreochromis]|uniref:Uncharacterized protein n=1 Tax=Flavobacterium columnare TaxID=996 RepID=A0A246GEE4_9FLAO|nr:hypothetical protein [Flavobacterium oreochromis]OWP79761.1 hypothetical protein BWK62_00570 [Flavobacterium oreochromis]